MVFDLPILALRPRSILSAICTLAILIGLFNGIATSQETPGQIEKRFEPPVLPRSTLEPLELKAPETLPPAEVEAIRFNLTGVVVQGSTVYKEREFTPLYQQYLNKEISLADVFRVRDAITAKYRNDGYILSRAIVPPQQITEGIVSLEIIEGFICQVRIEGQVRGRLGLLEAYGEKIKQSRPLQAKVLERYLLLTDDLPGVSVKSVLSPCIEQPGASDLILFIDHKTFDGTVSVDNRGSRSLGPYQFSAGVNVNSLLRLYERTGVRVVVANLVPSEIQELLYVQLTHDEQLGTEGTTLAILANYTKVEPGSTPTGLDVLGNGTTVSLSASHPFIRSRGENLSVTGRLTYRDSKIEFADENQQDRLRVIGIGATYDFADRFRGINLFGLEFSQGLDFFGATGSTRPEGRNDFQKVTGQILRLQQLAPSLSLLGILSGQYAFQPLLPSEDFLLGGAQFGRAYDPAELTGDYGVAFKLELQYGYRVDVKFLRDLQLYTFVDPGIVWRHKPTPDRPASETLVSGGLGVRFNLTEAISGYVEVDKPVNRDFKPNRGASPEGNRDPRVFFAIVGRF